MVARRQGQGGLYTFSGVAGQYINLAVSEYKDGIGGANVTISKPDGTGLASGQFAPTYTGAPAGFGFYGSRTINTVVLPVTGTYAVFVQQTVVQEPGGAPRGTGTLTLTVSTPLAGALVVGGSSLASTITRPGQGVQLSFSGAAAQNLALSLSIPCSTIGGALISILKPDSTNLASANMAVNACNGGSVGSLTLNAPVLPVSGIYTILFQQTGAGTGTLTSTLKTR